MSAKKQIVVPYVLATFGDTGARPIIVGRALARAGYGKLVWATRGRKKFDRRLAVLLGKYEFEHGLKTKRGPTWTYKPATHKKLARYYDKFNLKLANDVLAVSAEDKIRARVVSELMYLYNKRWGIPYSQARPYDRRRPPARGDCSGGKQWADEHGGAPQCGSPWGYGNTYSQLAFYRARNRIIVWGRSRDFRKVKPGDPVYYGSPSHVGVFLGVDAAGVARSWHLGSFPVKIRDVDYRLDRGWICSLLGENT